MEKEAIPTNFITQTEFAESAGVTKGAIYLANRRQPALVHIDEKTRKIDPNHPLNVAYRTNREHRTSRRQRAANLSKSINKELPTPGELEGIIKNILQDMATPAAATPAEAESEEKPQPTSAPETTSETNTAESPSEPEPQPRESNANPGNKLQNYDPEDIQAALQAKGRKAVLENLKIQKEQIQVAALSGELARRDHVETFIGIISGTISNYFLPLDFRLTATIMDICGITDQKIKLEIFY